MKKAIPYILTLLLLTLVSVSLTIYAKHKKSEELLSGTLCIDGKEITSENVTIHLRYDHSSYADLPFIETLKALGYTVEWINDNNAEIMYENKKYILNCSEIEMYEDGNTNGLNLLMPPCGGSCTRKASGMELILDDMTISHVLYDTGIKVYFDIDFENAIVYPVERDE